MKEEKRNETDICQKLKANRRRKGNPQRCS